MPSAKSSKSSKAPANKPAAKATKKSGAADASPELVADRIAELGDWRAETLGKLRKLIKEADPEVVEELKWRKPSNPGGVPVWSHDGMICTGESYKSHVKLTFFKGAELMDPKRLFNSSMEGTRRAIDLQEGDAVDEAAFKAIIRQAVALNAA
ncbi:MAG: DUF1801 domain-containing protein [Thermoplasmatota archaeon]